MAIATYTYDALPPAERAGLPPADTITAAFSGVTAIADEVTIAVAEPLPTARPTDPRKIRGHERRGATTNLGGRRRTDGAGARAEQVAITGHDHVSAEEPRCIAAAAQQTRAAAARTRPNSPPRSPSRASPRCPPLPRARSGQ